MRRHLLCYAAAGSVFIPTGTASAQSTIDALDNELKAAQQQHVDVTNKIVSAFFAQVDAGMASPNAAVTIYSDPAGINGPLPPPAPVVTQNEHETQTEKEAREAIDQANLARFGAALQMHCGLLHYGGLLALDPDRIGLKAAWLQWLKSAVPFYLQMAPPVDRNAQPDAAPAPPPPPSNNHEDRKHKHDVDRAAKASAYVPSEVRGKSLRDSWFTRFTGFTGFKNKDQADWSVSDIPSLYRANILDPLRAKPTMATLAAWDNVIAMANADERNNDRWNNDVNPGLQFERSCDAFLISPDMERLTVLVAFIRQYPTHPRVEDWIKRTHGYLQDYRAGHGPKVAPVPIATSPNTTTPPVSVTSEQQGDMTIVTTHTNGAPMAPPPPTAPAPAPAK